MRINPISGLPHAQDKQREQEYRDEQRRQYLKQFEKHALEIEPIVNQEIRKSVNDCSVGKLFDLDA
jgi:hypothetical protein